MLVDGVIYTVYSHADTMTAKQLPLLSTIGRVVVVEDDMFPAGIAGSTTIITKDKHSIIEHRTRIIAIKIFQQLVSQQKERYALIIHGDMLPTRIFTWPELFEDYRYTVAGYITPDGNVQWHTQLLGVDLSKGLLEPLWYLWPITECKIWDIHPIMENGRRGEKIEPCWQHVTQMTLDIINNQLASHSVLAQPVGINTPQTAPKTMIKYKTKKCGGCGKKHTKATAKKAIQDASKRKEINLQKLRKELL